MPCYTNKFDAGSVLCAGNTYEHDRNYELDERPILEDVLGNMNLWNHPQFIAPITHQFGNIGIPIPRNQNIPEGTVIHLTNRTPEVNVENLRVTMGISLPDTTEVNAENLDEEIFKNFSYPWDTPEHHETMDEIVNEEPDEIEDGVSRRMVELNID